MKEPEKMTRRELVEYVPHLKRMVSNLQGQLGKALESNASLYIENKRLKEAAK